jgi:DeoR family suf operon transcriptional repressor
VTRVPPPLSEARRDVLYAVRRRGEASVDDVARTLGMTESGARQHLLALVDVGLVVARDQPAERRGRPRRVYRVTDAAEHVFPTAYGELANELLGFLDQDTEAAVFDRRRDERIRRARERLDGLGLADRVAELTRILDEDGYMATCHRTEGGWAIVEHNCAIAAVAVAHPGACRSELDFIRTVLPDAAVERTEHMVAGATQCGYRVTPV